MEALTKSFNDQSKDEIPTAWAKKPNPMALLQRAMNDEEERKQNFSGVVGLATEDAK
jgi:hypothetical protein